MTSPTSKTRGYAAAKRYLPHLTRNMTSPTSETSTSRAITLLDILARDYADARAVLAHRVDVLQTEFAAARMRLAPGIRSALASAKAAQDALNRAIATEPKLFTKPRTFTLHGIKVGFQKGKGKLTWDDAQNVVARIDAVIDPDHKTREQLIETTETPRKEALMLLDAATLKKLGCKIEGTEDQVVIKADDTDLDKVIEKILEDGAQASTGE